MLTLIFCFIIALWAACNFVLTYVLSDGQFKTLMKYAGKEEDKAMRRSYLCMALSALCFLVAALIGYWVTAIFIVAYFASEGLLAQRVKQFFDGA